MKHLINNENLVREKNFMLRLAKQSDEINVNDVFDFAVKEDDAEYLKIMQDFSADTVDRNLEEKATKTDFIINHSSVNRLRFEFLTCILVFYDIIMLPFNLAFDVD